MLGRSRNSLARRLAVLSVLAPLAACQSAKPPAPVTPPVAPVIATATSALVPTAGLDSRARLRKLIELLDDGQRDQARVEAQELLREEPDNGLAKSLLNQIDADPKVLLGSASFSYTLQPGETLSSLAQRFLGDKLLFYALARYNGIDAPGKTEVGRTLEIPGRRPPAPVRRPPPPTRPTPPATPAPAPAAHDTARANALRSEALLHMNRGEISRAVALLRQASQADPQSGPVAADLARALRIQQATRP